MLTLYGSACKREKTKRRGRFDGSDLHKNRKPGGKRTMMQRSAENAKISKRNYYMMIIEGSLFWIGASFIDGNAVAVSYTHLDVYKRQL